MTTAALPLANPSEIADNPGPHLILLAILVLAGLGAYLYYRRRNKDQR